MSQGRGVGVHMALDGTLHGKVEFSFPVSHVSPPHFSLQLGAHEPSLRFRAKY